MSWFDTTGFASYAKTAINQAQKKLDKVLDIQDETSVNTPGSSSDTSREPKVVDDVIERSTSIDASYEISSNEVGQRQCEIDRKGCVNARGNHEQQRTAKSSKGIKNIKKNDDFFGGFLDNRPSLPSQTKHGANLSKVIKKEEEKKNQKKVATIENSKSDLDTNLPKDEKNYENESSPIKNDCDIIDQIKTSGADVKSVQSLPEKKTTITKPVVVENTTTSNAHTPTDQILINIPKLNDTPTDTNSVPEKGPSEIAVCQDEVELDCEAERDESVELEQNVECNQTGEDISQQLTNENVLSKDDISSDECNKNDDDVAIDNENEDGDDAGTEELSRLHNVIDARESKMIAMSRENILLQEEVEQLKSKLSQYSCLGNTDDTDTTTAELFRQIEALQSNLIEMTSERDAALEKQRLAESSAKNGTDLYSKAIQEKESLIAELLEEGEKLSKGELKLNNRIKRLSAKVKSMEEEIENERIKNEKLKAESSSIALRLKEEEEVNTKLKENIKFLETTIEGQDDDIAKLKDKIDDLEEKIEPLKDANESALQEINRLNLLCAQKASEAQDEVIQTAQLEQKQLQQKLTDCERRTEKEKISLQSKIDELQLALMRVEQQMSRREDQSRLELTDLQERLQQAEDRNQDLSQSATSASRPLLRQLEALQISHRNQLQSMESVEKNLTKRLAQAEEQCALACEGERAAKETTILAKSKVSALEAQIKQLKNEKMNVVRDIEAKKDDQDKLKEEISRIREEMVSMETKHRTELIQWQEEKKFFKTQLRDEKIRCETEIALIMKEKKSLEIASECTASEQLQQQQSTPTLVLGDTQTHRKVSSTMSSLESPSRPITTTNIDQILMQLKKKDGEIAQLQNDIYSLEKTKASLAQEIVNSAQTIEELTVEKEKYNEMENNLKELQSNYAAILQMYGEKAEEVDELKMDLTDVKEMYRQQIDQLVSVAR